jgi:hypothetical protein
MNIMLRFLSAKIPHVKRAHFLGRLPVALVGFIGFGMQDLPGMFAQGAIALLRAALEFALFLGSNLHNDALVAGFHLYILCEVYCHA